MYMYIAFIEPIGHILLYINTSNVLTSDSVIWNAQDIVRKEFSGTGKPSKVVRIPCKQLLLPLYHNKPQQLALVETGNLANAGVWISDQ